MLILCTNTPKVAYAVEQERIVARVPSGNSSVELVLTLADAAMFSHLLADAARAMHADVNTRQPPAPVILAFTREQPSARSCA